VNQTIRFSHLWMQQQYFFTEQGGQPYVQPPTWRTRFLYLRSQRKGGPVMPPDIAFLFRRLPRVARIRWRHSNSPTHRGPSLEDQVPVCMSPQWQGGPVTTPQAPRSLFVVSYDSQGCGGGILTRVHSRKPNISLYIYICVCVYF
jgi:hypothetical protein